MSRAEKESERDECECSWVVLSSRDLAVAERSEGERGELQRSASVAKGSADSQAGPRPDPEVMAKAKRRFGNGPKSREQGDLQSTKRGQ